MERVRERKVTEEERKERGKGEGMKIGGRVYCVFGFRGIDAPAITYLSFDVVVGHQ